MFLNIPYDQRYNSLYVAFIAGLCGLGLNPHTTLELRTGIGASHSPSARNVFSALPFHQLVVAAARATREIT